MDDVLLRPGSVAAIVTAEYLSMHRFGPPTIGCCWDLGDAHLFTMIMLGLPWPLLCPF